MSQPQSQHSDYTEYLPRQEARTLRPITTLPVNALSEDADPTVEIRTLIDQLQQTAREARTQCRTAEQEKSALLEQLARAEEENEALRDNERDLRSHFVEVTSLIQERDAAVAESGQRGQALAEAARQLDTAIRESMDAQRQRDEAGRQREETVRKFEAFNRASEEQVRLIGETQRQILNIRQARDAAHAQIVELTNRLSRTEDEAADFDYQREVAEKALKQAATETAEFRRQLEATMLDRDVTARQVEELTHELDGQRRKLLDFAEQKTAVLQADSEHLAALAEARAQVLSSTQERDAARGRAQEQARELEELRAQFQKFREEEAHTAAQALADAHDKLAAAETQARDARHAAQNLRQELDSVSQRLTALQALGEAAALRQAGTERELAALTEERAAAQASADAAQKELADLLAGRDRDRAQAVGTAVAAEGQLTALRSQLAGFENAAADAKTRQEDLQVLQKRFEKQRVETIDIVARLQSAQHEIRELSASLAEARLQVKFATAAGRATKSGATKSDFASLVSEAATAAPAERAEPLATGVEDTLTEREAKSALGAMRQCFQSFTRTPSDLSLLNELHCHVHGFSERARTSGYLGVHRLCTAFSELTRGLYEYPGHVNQSTLRTVQQTVEFLGTILRERGFAAAQDPAKALIYAVDDDLENCESIQMALETYALRTTCAQQPVEALTELANSRYDLIFLDVNLPGMDGFELCSHIRGLDLHATTPVIFLTGLATLENRAQSTACGGNDFVGKPFNLHELSVKAMTLILKTQLQLA